MSDPTIYDFGFDASLNIPAKDTGTPLIYDGISDAIQSQQLAAGGNLTLKNLTISGISKMVSPGDDLQSALNTINNAGGGTLLMKAGTYTQKTPLVGYSSTTIQGISSSSTLISFEGSANLSFTGTEVYTTGTITSIGAGVNVVGSGTAWLTKAKAGQYLFIGTRHYKIAAVTSDTTLILAEGYTDNVTMPGAAYRISTAIINVRLKDFAVTGSTGTGITFTDVVQPDLLNIVAYSCNKGVVLTNVSRATLDRISLVTNTSNGIEFTNVGLCVWQAINAISNGNHGFVFNNVKTVGAIGLSSTANTSDGFNLTTTVQTNLLVEAQSNSSQGMQLVSGCDENEIDGLFVSNTNDGVKLTASDNRNKVTGIYKSNGGYGINIADATDNDNTIDVPTFKTNVSGTYQDLGTNTNVVTTITQADKQIFTANGTWTKPASIKLVYVTCIGAGGGGAGGDAAAAGDRSGGSGGGGASVNTAIFSASDLAATVVITIGTAGTGGASATNGGDGGSSSFGTWLAAYGGGGGITGGGPTGGGGASVINNAVSVTGGTPTVTTGNAIAGQGTTGAINSQRNAEWGGATGGSAIAGSVGVAGGSSINAGPGGGGGGGTSAANAANNGLDGGLPRKYSAGGGGAGGTGAGTGGVGIAGLSNATLGILYTGSAGGGGGSSTTNAIAGGAGGNGGAPGAGGGGGGSAGIAGGGAGGAGGTGGRGEVRVYSI